MPLTKRIVNCNANGLACEGLLVWDDAVAGARPTVMVSHTIRGRSNFEESRAAALARLGYAALVLDLYGADTRGASLEQLKGQMNALMADRIELQGRMLAWLDLARQQSEIDAGRIAAIGFCFGGLCVLDLARTGADVAGVASFHGLLAPPGNTLDKRVAAKVLVLHGWDDPLATPDQVRTLAQELTAMGADWQIHAYGNTLHAFTNPAANDKNAGTVYDANADRRSWSTLQDFLSEIFQGSTE